MNKYIIRRYGFYNIREERYIFRSPLHTENINKCKFPQCPVQANSKCAQDKLERLKMAVENMPDGEVPCPRTLRECTVLQAKQSARTLTLTSNVSVTPVMSG